MAGDLPARFLEHVRAAGVFAQPGTALLAVSGGPDSTALFHLLHLTARDLQLELVVGHVDHGIVEGSHQAARQVAALVRKHSVPFMLRELNLGPRTSESRARRARYQALREMQRKAGARYLVTAHHADDQIETVLWRMLRGSGMAGLAGMRPVGPNGLVRPLLAFRRDELRDWLQQYYAGLGERPVVFADPANLDSRYDRVWIRRALLPLLRERFGDKLESRLLQLAQHAARDLRAWGQVLTLIPDLEISWGSEGIELNCVALNRLPEELGAAVVSAAAREAGLVLTPRQTTGVLAFARSTSSGRQLKLGAGWVAERSFERLRLGRLGSRPPSWGTATWGETPEGTLRWGRWVLSWRSEPAGRVERGGVVTWVTVGPGWLREPRPGDKMVPFGGTGHRRVRRLLMEAKIPVSERSYYPLLGRGEEILWLPGVCRSASAVPAEGDVALRLEIEPASGFGSPAVLERSDVV